MTKYNERSITLIRNAYQKLDSLPLGFGLPSYSNDLSDEFIYNKFGIDIKDTLREMGITDIDTIQENSYDEMIIENRIVYHAIKRFRHSAAIFFKFSTAIDGKTVDKTKIPQMLSSILKEYEDEYSKYKSHNCGSLWQMNIDSDEE